MTVSTEVAKQPTSQMVTAYKDDFAAVLPSHIKTETWVRLAVGALRRDEKLRQAAEHNPASLMVALLDAVPAITGHAEPQPIAEEVVEAEFVDEPCETCGGIGDHDVEMHSEAKVPVPA
jgi:hypothetical protein